MDATIESPVLEAALRYAELGYPVLPLHTVTEGKCDCGRKDCHSPGKHPRTRHGLKDATTDPNQIETWWTTWPRANIGIATERLLVLDFDPGSGGWPQPAEAIDFAGCPIQTTPRGGRHVVYRAPAGRRFSCSTGKLAEHVDVRADGGYIVVAPSRHDHRAYQWQNPLEARDALPEPPTWLLTTLDATGKNRTPASVATANVFEPGVRNDRLMSIGGQLRNLGFSHGEIAGALHEVNLERCRPPLDRAEVDRIAANLGRYTPAVALDDSDVDLSELLRNHGFARPEPGPFPLLSPREVHHGNFRVHYLVKGVLAAEQACVVGGPAKSLKTTLLLDMAVSLASGTPWLGHFATPAPEPVLMMTGESGMCAVQNMLRRISAARGVDLDHDEQLEANLAICEKLPQLSNLQHMDLVAQILTDRGFRLLIVDPLYLSLDNADTSSLTSMGPLFRRANEACLASGCTLVVAHHTVKKPGFGTGRSAYDPLAREDLHGAGIAEWARQWILINRAAPYEEGTGRHELNVVLGGSAGHSSRWLVQCDEGAFDADRLGWPGPGLERWDVSVASARQVILSETQRKQQARLEKANEELSENCATLLAVMRKLGPATMRQIRESSFGGKRFEATWRHLLEEKQIRPHADGVTHSNGQTYPAFEVVRE